MRRACGKKTVVTREKTKTRELPFGSGGAKAAILNLKKKPRTDEHEISSKLYSADPKNTR
jgi:hypothetical protein